MRPAIKLLTISFFLSCWLWVGSAQGLVTILGDQDGQSGISVKFTAEDDLGDNDQSFPETDHVIVQIDNNLRRYLTVFIDRIIMSTEPIDNGPNDEYIGTSAKVFSFKTLKTFFEYISGGTVGPPPSSRRYLLPLPDDMQPGTEVRFRIKVWGPALGGWLPVDGKTNDRLIKVTAATTFEMLLLPLLSSLIGSEEFNFDMDFLLKDFIEFGGLEIDVMTAWENNDIEGVLEPIIKYIAGSNTLKEKLGGDTAIGNITTIKGLQELLLKPLSIAELFNVMIHLTTSRWEEEYDVLIIPPKVDRLEPNTGVAGDIVTIEGVGFDTYEIDNNRVYFTRLNSTGTPIPDAEAFIVGVPAEDTMIVKVPTGFYPGPVLVCTTSSIGDKVHTYCSNLDVNFMEPLASGITITSPADAATVSGTIDVNVLVGDPADPFPESQATLLVDDEQVDQKLVYSPSFSFSLDTGTLSEGPHSIEVQLDISGQKLSASVNINIQATSGPQLVIHSPSSGTNFKRNEVIQMTAGVLNGPDEIQPGYDNYILYVLDIDSIREESRRCSLNDNLTDCYQFFFSFANSSMVPGPHNITLKAWLNYFSNGQYVLTEMTASTDFIIDDEFIGDSNSIHIDGCIPMISPVTVYLNWDEHNVNAPVWQLFTFGTCGPDSSGYFRNYLIWTELQKRFGSGYSGLMSYTPGAVNNTEGRFFTIHDDEGCPPGYPEGCWKIGWENYDFIMPDGRPVIPCCTQPGGFCTPGAPYYEEFCRISKQSRTWCQPLMLFYDCDTATWYPPDCDPDNTLRLNQTNRFKFSISSAIGGGGHYCPEIEIVE